MRVKYIGTCIKTDSITGVGMRWQPGQIRNVTAELAERLICFTDTWEKTDEDAADAEPVGLAQAEKPAEEPLPVVDFHSMTKKAMAEYSQERFNVKLDSRMSENDMRHRLIGLQAEHHADTGK